MGNDFESRPNGDAAAHLEEQYQKLWDEVDRRSRPGVEATTYTMHQLRRIGDICSKRTPPASAIQGMFLYEMQRASESEKLFHDQMFRLARQDDTWTSQEKRIAMLEGRLAKVEKLAHANNAQERVVINKIAMQNQQAGVNNCTERIDGLGGQVSGLQKQLDSLRIKQEDIESKPSSHNGTAGAETQTIKEEIDVLFDDRDGILYMIEEVKTRLSHLEGNVRAVTSQGIRCKARSGSSQLIPIQAPSGASIELAIPKGKAHVTMEENQRPSIMRDFSTGTKQNTSWGGAWRKISRGHEQPRLSSR